MKNMSMNLINAIAMSELALPSEVLNIRYSGNPTPNTKNDNAAQRQRAAKKRRNARSRK